MRIEKLLATLATGRKIEGTIVVSKLDDGKQFAVTDADPKTKTVTVTEVLPEDAPEDAEAKVIVITEAMEDSFSYQYNPNPKIVPAASVSKGVLIVGDRSVRMGDLIATGVVATKENEVLLVTKTAEDDDLALYRYQVDEDKFIMVPNISQIGDLNAEIIDGMIILTNVITDEVVQKDKDGKDIVDAAGNPVTKTVLVENQIGQWQENGYVAWIDTESYTDDYDEFDEDSDGDRDVILPIDTMEVVSYGDKKTLVAVSRKTLDEEGYLVDNDGAVLVYLIGVKTNKVHDKDVQTLFSGFPLYTEVAGDDPLVKITYDGRSIGWVIKTDKELVLSKRGEAFRTTNPSVVAALDGYDNYIGTFRKKELVGEDQIVEVTRIKFAKDDYTSKAIVVKPLGDNRGADITVE